jgi:flagellar M-ring protein FliF
VADGGQSGTGLGLPGGPSQGNALERVGALAGEVRSRFRAMPPQRRRWMGVSALLIAAVCAAMTWYAGRTDWRVLFSGLEAKDTQQISQELTAAGVAYRLTPDGSGIEVDADQVDKARMEVAAKGMPQSGRMGFELFDKPNWVGSEFDEKVNYQRALEGELEHTIGTLAVVRSARVHLVLPKDSLFGGEESSAKASVVLQLRRSVMPPEQAEAIRSLVAGAVENLSSADVTLVDADGRLNLAVQGRGAIEGDTERALEDKLIAMLEPTAGAGNVRASVNVAYDEGSQEKTDEVYDPAQVATLSMHKSEQSTSARSRASGIPGTLSNTPGASGPNSLQPAPAKPAAVPPLMQAGNAAAQSSSTQKNAGLPVYPQNGFQGDGETATEETGTYAVTRHLLHSEQVPGRVRRVTAAVVVNDRMSNEGSGKLAHTVWKPRNPEEMQRLEQLARAAVGFDPARGDEVVLENVSFSSNTPEPTATGVAKVMEQTDVLLHSQPGLLRTVTFSALGLLLVVLVLKPVGRQMVIALSQAPKALLAGQGAPMPGGSAGKLGGAKPFGQVGIPSLATLVAGRRPTDTQEIYEHISDQIRREPTQSTRLLESWINAPVEEEE